MEQGAKLAVVLGHDGHPRPPFLEPRDRRGTLHRLPALVTRRDLLVADHRRHLDARRPSPARGNDGLVHHMRTVDPWRPAEVDVRGALERMTLVPEGDTRALARHVELALFLYAPFLDLEEVGEIGVDQELDRAERRFLSVVLDLEVFAHAPPDVTAPEEHQVRIRVALRRLGPKDEHAAEGIGCGRG